MFQLLFVRIRFLILLLRNRIGICVEMCRRSLISSRNELRRLSINSWVWIFHCFFIFYFFLFGVSCLIHLRKMVNWLVDILNWIGGDFFGLRKLALVLSYVMLTLQIEDMFGVILTHVIKFNYFYLIKLLLPTGVSLVFVSGLVLHGC